MVIQDVGNRRGIHFVSGTRWYGYSQATYLRLSSLALQSRVKNMQEELSGGTQSPSINIPTYRHHSGTRRKSSLRVLAPCRSSKGLPSPTLFLTVITHCLLILELLPAILLFENIRELHDWVPRCPIQASGCKHHL